MAHKIIGVDFGGATLKVARFEAGFRRAALLDVATYEVTERVEPNASAGERVAAILAALKRALVENRVQAEEIALALPGDLVTFRIVDLPFSDPRRIESVLGYELESQVLAPIEELVVDHVVVGPHGGGTRVLVAAAPRVAIQAVIQGASELGLPIRCVSAAPLAFAATVGDRGPSPSLAVDVGHDWTTVCALRGGRPELARSIPRAGRHFSEHIAATFRLDAEAAERAKLDAGFIGNAEMRAESPGQKRMDECLREAARPLVRELRQTIASYRSSYNAGIERIWLSGGGAQLPGLREHLAAELEIPVDPLPWVERQPNEKWATVDDEARDRQAIAVGVGIAASSTAPQVNFRRGEFSFRSDYSFLRGKALYLAGALLVVLGFAALNAYASLRGLRREQDQLATRLKRETIDLFGVERTDAKAVSEEVKGGPKGQTAPPIPTITAFDVLDEISRRAPPGDKMQLDITELDIKPKKTFLKATAATGQQVEDLTEALKKIECFEDVQPGKVSTVSGPSSTDKEGKEQKSDLKLFTLNIVTTCP